MSRRRPDAGTVPLNPGIHALPRRVPRNSESQPGQSRNRRSDWFRIENHANSDTTEIYIYDEIGFWGTSAADFVKQMMEVETSRIDVHLNSPGGEVFDGVAIYNALKSHSATVTVYVDSLAASAAAFIAQAGDEVVMAPSSTMMIHDAMGVCIGNQKDMTEAASLLGKVSNNIADIYAQNAGGTIADWRSVMELEAWYTAQEAVDAGLADRVNNQPTDPTATNHWDLSVFNYAGRQEAPSPQQLRLQITNRAKEASVGNTADQSKSGTEPKVEPADGAPAVDEDKKNEGEQTPAVPLPAVDEGTQSSESLQPTPTNSAGAVNFQFIINGQRVSDPAKVQAHISALEGAQTEAKVANRKAFIKNLCDERKITAAQVNDLEALVLGADDEPGMTDKQYDRWTKTWNVAAPVVGLQPTPDGITNENGNTPAQLQLHGNKAEDELEVAREIVKNNKTTMPKAMLEKTPSWLKLAAAGVDPSTI
jgi:ATP-dependent protease ClpP protease subunit